MAITAFYGPPRGVTSITGEDGRLRGWTDASGNTVNRVGRGVNAAGGSMNVFEYADPRLADPRLANPRLANPNGAASQARSQQPAASVSAARAADLVEKPAAPPKKPRMTERQRDKIRDRVKAMILRDNPALKNTRWARELMARHPAWFR